jgi:hypothetical protein
MKTPPVKKFFPFTTGVTDTGSAPSVATSSKFLKIIEMTTNRKVSGPEDD